MTHGLADFGFSYPNGKIGPEIKEALDDWKKARYVKQGRPVGCTPGYPSWHEQRGKGFVAPRVQGPSLPPHNFDDPIDYLAEAEGRYESLRQEVEEKEKLLKAEHHLIMLEKEQRSANLAKVHKALSLEKRKTAKREQEMEEWKGRYIMLERALKKKEERLSAMDQHQEALQEKADQAEAELSSSLSTIFHLKNERDELKKEKAYWDERSLHFEKEHQSLFQKSCELLEDAQGIAEKARKRAKEAEEVEFDVPYGRARDFISSIKKDLNHLGRFF